MNDKHEANSPKLPSNRQALRELPSLKRYAVYIAILVCLIVVLSVLIGSKIYVHNQEVINVRAHQKLISNLRTEALQQQINGDLDKAENLYTQALSEAEKSGSSAEMIEFLSRLVQIKIKNHKLGQTTDLVRLAISLGMAIQNAHASNSGIATWLDDMANAFYSKGENSTREDIKEFCMRRYLDIQLETEDHYDPILFSRGVLFCAHLGGCAEATSYGEKMFDYTVRTKGNDPNIMYRIYFHRGRGLLGAHQPLKAEEAFNKFFQEKKKIGASLGDEAALNKWLGCVREEQGNLSAAKYLYQRALNLDKRFVYPQDTVGIGQEEVRLALLEERMSEITEASRMFQASLSCFNKCLPPKVAPGERMPALAECIYSGRVISAEHLAQIELKRGNLGLANSLQKQAANIRAQNPLWKSYSNKEQERAYVIGGSFMCPPQDFLPTHIRLQF